MSFYRRAFVSMICVTWLLTGVLAATPRAEESPAFDWNRAVRDGVKEAAAGLSQPQQVRRSSGSSRRKKLLIAASVGLGFGLYTGYRISVDSGSSKAATMAGVGALFGGLGLAVGYAMPEAHPGTREIWAGRPHVIPGQPLGHSARSATLKPRIH